MQKLKRLLKSIYIYFSFSPKKHLEYCKLDIFLEIKGNKVLKNVKTRWISMLSPTKKVLKEYESLVVKVNVSHTDTTMCGSLNF